MDFSMIPVSLVLGAVLVILLFWYYNRCYTYWKNAGVPYVKPFPFVGSLLDNISKPLHETDVERYRKFGRIYGYYECSRPVLVVAEPSLIREILIKDFRFFPSRRTMYTEDPIDSNLLPIMEGEKWKKVRSVVSHMFSSGKLKMVVSIFTDCSNTLCSNLLAASKDGKTIDAKHFLSAFTMDVIARAAFSTKIDSHNDPSNDFVVMANQVWNRKIPWRLVIYTFFPGLTKLFKMRFQPTITNKFFVNVSRRIIGERRKSGQKGNDLVQLLLDASESVLDEEESSQSGDICNNYKDEHDDKVFFKNHQRQPLSENEMIAQCVVFFLAGFESAATTLSLIAYELAKNSEVQEKLIGEVDEVLKSTDGQITYEAVQKMKYLDNVISEAMRMHTPGTRLERKAHEDYKLGDTGIVVPKDMIVVIPVYALHKDEEFFPNPDKFDPDRFTDRQNSDYTFLPFGCGPRNCVAMRFALLEMKVCLATVLSQFRLKICPQTKIPLQFYNGQGTLNPKSIELAVEERNDTK